jgi:phosphohistidine phosphatase
MSSSRDLVLWRHADAGQGDDSADDFLRPLTAKGERQAARMAAWLKRQLPQSTRVLCSPATRTEQTVRHLELAYKLRDELGPGTGVADMLSVSQWGTYKGTTVIVGHQPTLGLLVAHAQMPGWLPGQGALSTDTQAVSLRKGSLWWLRLRDKEDRQEVVVVCVQTPELM